MNIFEICEKITSSDFSDRDTACKRGRDFLETGLAYDNQENVRYYHFPFPDKRAYLYIWNFRHPSELSSGICPPCEELTFVCPFENGQTTQPHIQDFVMLTYVAKGNLSLTISDNFREDNRLSGRRILSH